MKRRSIWFLLSLGFPFLLFTTILALVVVLRRGNYEEEGSYVHNYIQYNPEISSSSSGTVTLNEEFEYSFSYDGEGNYGLISNIENDEYFCTGSCVCQDESERRTPSTNTFFTRGMIFLVASASSILALREAKEYFQEECELEFSDEDSCPSTSTIVSMVDDCSRINEEKEVEEVKETKVYDDPDNIYLGEFNIYWCHGYCLVNHKIRKPEQAQHAKEFGCEKMLLEKEVMLDSSMYSKGVHEGKLINVAMVWFKMVDLTVYCIQNSKNKTILGTHENAHFCHSHQERGINHSIECKKTYPELLDIKPLKKERRKEYKNKFVSKKKKKKNKRRNWSGRRV